MWLCCHPLTEPGHEDRMTTRRLTSDGRPVLDGPRRGARRPPGEWDARGARVTAVLASDPVTVLYDGRADAASNWHETTGVARWDGTRLVPVDDVRRSPPRTPTARGATPPRCRCPDGRARFYIEAARPDGAHDLVTIVR